MHDYFVAALRCPRCGEQSAIDHATNIKTRIRAHPSGVFLGEGDRIAFELSELRRRGYRLVRSPRPGEGARFIEAWACPRCEGRSTWAMVSVLGGVIQRITAIAVDHAALELAHYVSDAGVEVVERELGASLTTSAGSDVVMMLREVLAKRSQQS